MRAIGGWRLGIEQAHCMTSERVSQENMPSCPGNAGPGGMCILTTPAAWTDMVLRVLATLRLVDPVMINEHRDVYSHAKISAILQRGGFARDRIRFGYFEVFVSIWATATKSHGPQGRG